MKKKRSVFNVFWKTGVVFAHVIKILWSVFWRFSKFDIPKRQEILQQWAWDLLRILDVTVEQQGQPMLTQGCLRTSNHVSWLDMVVLYACSPCRFIAKFEVKGYPFIGRIASNAGTLFLKRGNVKDAIRMSEMIGDALKEGDCVAFFPEGTTSHGEGILPLHASLFEGAIQGEAYVQTTVLRFHSSASTRACKEAAYVERNLISTLWHILRHGDIKVSITGMEPFKVNQNNERRQICTHVQKEMEATLNRLNYNKQNFSEDVEKVTDEQLKEVFLSDASDWLIHGQQGLKKLVNNPASKDGFFELRQSFHLLKGGASMVGLVELSLAAQADEQYLDGWLSTKKPASNTVLEFAETSLADLSNQCEELRQGVKEVTVIQEKVVLTVSI